MGAFMMKIDLITKENKGRPFSLPLYLLMVVGLSWPFQIAYAFYAQTQIARFVLSSLAMIMVSAATWLAGRFVFRDGFRGAGWNWGRPRQYLFTFLLALFIFALPAAIELAFGLRTLPDGLPLAAMGGAFAVGFVLTLLPGFGEEFGWRGYMLPRMACVMSMRKALIWHGVIWWAWHLPTLVGAALSGDFFSGPAWLQVTAMLAITLVPSAMNAVLFAYVWDRSGSLAVASAYHSAYDEVRDAIGKTIGFGPLAPLWEMAATTLLGLLALFKGKWHLAD
jgi:membrane protease YdiL (CAAX protease family)